MGEGLTHLSSGLQEGGHVFNAAEGKLRDRTPQNTMKSVQGETFL